MVIRSPIPPVVCCILVNSWGVSLGCFLSTHHFSPFRYEVAFTMGILAPSLPSNLQGLRGSQSCHHDEGHLSRRTTVAQHKHRRCSYTISALAFGSYFSLLSITSTIFLFGTQSQFLFSIQPVYALLSQDISLS